VGLGQRAACWLVEGGRDLPVIQPVRTDAGTVVPGSAAPAEVA